MPRQSDASAENALEFLEYVSDLYRDATGFANKLGSGLWNLAYSFALRTLDTGQHHALVPKLLQEGIEVHLHGNIRDALFPNYEIPVRILHAFTVNDTR